MAQRTIDPQAIEAEVAALGGLDLAALRQRWEPLIGNPPPKSLRRAFLVKACAYGIQVKAFGGLSAATKKRLCEIADAARTGTSVSASSSRSLSWPAGSSMAASAIARRQSDHRDKLEWPHVLPTEEGSARSGCCRNEEGNSVDHDSRAGRR